MPSKKTPRPSDFTRRENLVVLSIAGLALLAILLAVFIKPRGYRLHHPSRSVGAMRYVDNLTLNDTKYMMLAPGATASAFDAFADLYQNGYLEKARETMLSVVKGRNEKAALTAAYNNLANIHDDIGEYNRARQYYQQAVAFGPKDPFLHFNWGTSLYHSGLNQASLEQFRLSEKYRHGFDKALMNIANIEFELKQYQKACADYGRIPARSGLERQARYNTAVCLAALGAAENRKRIQQIYYGLLTRSDNIAYLSALNLGNASYNDGDYEKAADYFRMACTINTQNYTAFFNLALLEKRRHDYAAAIGHFQRAVQNRKSFGDVYRHLGEIYYNQSDTSSSIFQFEKFLAGTNDITATAMLADLYYENGRETWPDAVDLYSRIIERTTGSEKKIALANTGNIFFGYTNYPAAMKSYQEALKLEPDDPNLLFNMGLVCSRLRQYPEALQYFQKTLAIEPENDRPLMNVILVYQKMNRIARAIDLCEQRIAENNGDLQFQLLLASLYVRDRSFEKARAVLERMETDDPVRLVQKYLMLSFVHFRLSDLPTALAFSEKALTMDPSNHEALLNSGLILFAMDRYEDSISRFVKVVAVTEDPVLLGTAYLNLGNSYYRKGELSLAFDFYDKALALLPDSNAVHLNWKMTKNQLRKRS